MPEPTNITSNVGVKDAANARINPAKEDGNLASIKAKTDNIPAQGQALAAASLPVVLTAAQQTALTPPAAISGFATAAKQDLLQTPIDYRFSGGKSASVATIAASGNTDLVTPSAGMKIRVFWISCIPDSDNSAGNRINIGFGASGGAITTLLYRANVLAHWEVFTGLADEVLIISTETAEPIDITVHYQEIA